MAKSYPANNQPNDAKPKRAKPELTDADKALLNAEPDWERMSEGAKRLMATPPAAQNIQKKSQRKADLKH